MDTIIFLALLAVSIQYLVLYWIGYINIQKKLPGKISKICFEQTGTGWFDL